MDTSFKAAGAAFLGVAAAYVTASSQLSGSREAGWESVLFLFFGPIFFALHLVSFGLSERLAPTRMLKTVMAAFLPPLLLAILIVPAMMLFTNPPPGHSVMGDMAGMNWLFVLACVGGVTSAAAYGGLRALTD